MPNLQKKLIAQISSGALTGAGLGSIIAWLTAPDNPNSESLKIWICSIAILGSATGAAITGIVVNHHNRHRLFNNQSVLPTQIKSNFPEISINERNIELSQTTKIQEDSKSEPPLETVSVRP